MVPSAASSFPIRATMAMPSRMRIRKVRRAPRMTCGAARRRHDAMPGRHHRGRRPAFARNSRIAMTAFHDLSPRPLSAAYCCSSFSGRGDARGIKII